LLAHVPRTSGNCHPTITVLVARDNIGYRRFDFLMISIDTAVVVCGLALILYFGWSLRRGLVRTVLPLCFFVVGFGFAYLLDESTIDTSLSLESIGLLFAFLIAGYFVKYLFDVRFEPRLAKKGMIKAARLLLLDFRVVAVFIGLLISILLTFPFYDLSVNEVKVAAEATKVGEVSPGLPGFWLSFYSNWVSSVLFFAIVGLVAGLTALYRPEADVFAARVQILLGGKSGPAVDYIATKLGEIGYVARLTQRKVVIEEYSEEMKAFKLRVLHSTWIKNLYHDVKTDAAGRIAFFHIDELVPEPAEYGSLISFRINGFPQPDLPARITKADFERPWSFIIPGDEEGTISYEHWFWYPADKEHSFTLGRFTENLDVEIKARCRDKKVKVIFTAGTQTKETMLGYDEEYRVAPILDQYPSTIVYRFTLAVESGEKVNPPALNQPQSTLDYPAMTAHTSPTGDLHDLSS
jgi:hypothetical protein